MRRKRTYQILLVEDNPGDVRLTQEAFLEANVPVELIVVMDGLEATKFVNRQAPYESAEIPDLVLLDVNLPKKNGIEVLKEIKASVDFKKVPVVMLTTSTAQKDVDAAYDNHANCYINKPVDFDSFFKVVKTVEQFWLSTVVLPYS